MSYFCILGILPYKNKYFSDIKNNIQGNYPKYLQIDFCRVEWMM